MAKKLHFVGYFIAAMCFVVFFSAYADHHVFALTTTTITNINTASSSPTSETITGQIATGEYDAASLAIEYGIGTDRSRQAAINQISSLTPNADLFTVKLNNLTPGAYNFTISDNSNATSGGFSGGSGSFTITSTASTAVISNLSYSQGSATSETITGNITPNAYDPASLAIEYGIGTDRSGQASIQAVSAPGTDGFSITLNNLTPGTYNFNISDNSNATTGGFSGGSGSFEISGAIVTLNTPTYPVSGAGTSVTITGTITSGEYDPGSFVIDYGICSDRSEEDDVKISSMSSTGTDAFTVTLTGLTPGIYNFLLTDDNTPDTGFQGSTGTFTIANADGSAPPACPPNPTGAPTGPSGGYTSPIPGMSLPGLVPLALQFGLHNTGTITSAILKCKSVQAAIKNGISAVAGFFGLTVSFPPDNSALSALAAKQQAATKAAAALVYQSRVGPPTPLPPPVPPGSVPPVVTGTAAITTVPVNDLGTQAKLEQLRLEQVTTSTNAGLTAGATTTLSNKLTCYQTIEKAAAQIILKVITQQTIAWINTGGFPKGAPLYITNTGASLQKLADAAVGNFTDTIGCIGQTGAAAKTCQAAFPFGQNAAKMLISQTQSYFEKTAQFSLNQVIAQGYPGTTSVDFGTNFASGGWNAFLASAMPNNNPFGFNAAAQNTLSTRLVGTNYTSAQDLKDQIRNNSGFLDQRVCTTPAGADADPNGNFTKTTDCKSPNRWVTQTPGSTIAKSLDQALGDPTSQLLVGTDITTDIGAILDSLLNHYMQQGLKSIKP